MTIAENPRVIVAEMSHACREALHATDSGAVNLLEVLPLGHHLFHLELAADRLAVGASDDAVPVDELVRQVRELFVTHPDHGLSAVAAACERWINRPRLGVQA